MKKLIAMCALLGMFSVVAFADETPAEGTAPEGTKTTETAKPAKKGMHKGHHNKKKTEENK